MSADITICSVSGCDKPVSKRGLCNAHYLRLKRRGTTDRDPKWIRGRHCRSDLGQCPAAKKISNHLDYVANREHYKKASGERYRKNLDQIKVYNQRDEVKEKSRARTRQWSKDNPERKRQMGKKFYENNRALVNSYKAKRRAVVLKATPPWTTMEMIEQIRAVYAEAERLTQETGIPQQVDHIVPLQGKICCGLHVPWNLRVITAVDNNRRPRIFSE